MNYACIHNVYDGSTKPFGSSTWAAEGWGSGSDREGVRLAQLRREQASNTNQGDLVMERRLTESPLCLRGVRWKQLVEPRHGCSSVSLSSEKSAEQVQLLYTLHSHTFY